MKTNNNKFYGELLKLKVYNKCTSSTPFCLVLDDILDKNNELLEAVLKQ